MTDAISGAAPEPTRLQAPLARLLRPLVRLLVHSGITFPAICDLLRELYVNVAEYDFVLAGKSQTDSRVSLLTGIHRKEVARLRGAGAPVSVVPAAVSRASRILALWIASPDFTDADGRPLPLARAAIDGSPSFEGLVGAVTRDLRARAVLDEWLDRRLVVLDADDRVVLTDTAFVPRGGSDQQLYYFGRNLHDHVAAAVSNVLGEEPVFTERAVHYDGLSADLALSLEGQSRLIANEALQKLNQKAAAACRDDPGGRWRWNCGVYIYREEMPSSEVATPGSAEAERDA